LELLDRQRNAVVRHDGEIGMRGSLHEIYEAGRR
jgi:hypothetical protein